MRRHQLGLALKRQVREIVTGLEPDEDPAPVALISDGATVLPVPLASMMGDRTRLGVVLGLLVKLKHPESLGLVMTMWVVVQKLPEDAAFERIRDAARTTNQLPDGRVPSEHPDRREAVQVTTFDTEGWDSYMAFLQRRPGRAPRLGAFESFAGGGIEGRLFDPLLDAYGLTGGTVR